MKIKFVSFYHCNNILSLSFHKEIYGRNGRKLSKKLHYKSAGDPTKITARFYFVKRVIRLRGSHCHN